MGIEKIKGTNIQQDIHLAYNALIEDIRFAKAQQWKITYYAFLVLGSVAYFSKHAGYPTAGG